MYSLTCLIGIMVLSWAKAGFTPRTEVFPARSFNFKLKSHDVNSFQSLSATEYKYTTHYFTVPVDHFGYANQDVFSMRYLMSNEHWEEGGPILFYTGNEGDIAWFCNNTGFMWDIAPEFKALLVFAEHRYYGETMPYGKDSYKDVSKLGYLSSEQALADYADLLVHLKSTLPGAQNSPIIAMGGSYGGMLAAWFRIKYPHIVVGALAASAPILWFENLTPCNAFFKVTTKDFERESTACADNIRHSWETITAIGQSGDGLAFISNAFHLCKPLKTAADVTAVKAWLVEVWGNLAMVDYPYAASFLAPLPAWPIKSVCAPLAEAQMEGKKLIQAIGDAISVYFNYTGSTPCLNTSSQGDGSMGDEGWNFQACTEMVMPMCSDGKTDMFEPTAWDIKTYDAGCKKQFNVHVRPNWAVTEYGGRNITASSNIIFSNGLLDPWSGGGVMESLSDTLVAIVIAEGAHHLDLRAANPEDPASVIKARDQEKQIMKGWIKQYQQQNTFSGMNEEVLELTINMRAPKPLYVALIVMLVISCVALIALLGVTYLRKQRRHWTYQQLPAKA